MRKINVRYTKSGYEVNVRVVGGNDIFLSAESNENFIFCDKANFPSAVEAQIFRMSGEINGQSGAVILLDNPSEPVLSAYSVRKI